MLQIKPTINQTVFHILHKKTTISLVYIVNF